MYYRIIHESGRIQGEYCSEIVNFLKILLHYLMKSMPYRIDNHMNNREKDVVASENHQQIFVRSQIFLAESKTEKDEQGVRNHSNC